MSLLIAHAGIIDFKSIEKSTIDFWKKIIDVNLTGTFINCPFYEKIKKVPL